MIHFLLIQEKKKGKIKKADNTFSTKENNVQNLKKEDGVKEHIISPDASPQPGRHLHYWQGNQTWLIASTAPIVPRQKKVSYGTRLLVQLEGLCINQ